MDKYKINYIYSENNDLNDIFIKVLNKEIKKYLIIINKKSELATSYAYISQERKL